MESKSPLGATSQGVIFQPALITKEWMRDDRLRQPVFLGLREDEIASEVMREKAT